MATIALVEDDSIVRECIRRMIEMQGHTVNEFADAADALEADFGSVELIITDLTMPTPGEVLIGTLRSRGSQIPIIVVTGQLEQDTMDYLKSLGAQSFLAKPLILQELHSEIRKYINQWSPQ